MSRRACAGAAAALVALAGLGLVARRGERGLEDAVNADLARSAAAFLAVVTPGGGGPGYDAPRLLSGVGALAISSFWRAGLQGALGRTPFLPDTIGLTPLPEPVAERLAQGAPRVIATHARVRVALAPLFDRDRRAVLGWIGVWGALARPGPDLVVPGLFALAALALAGAWLRCRRAVPLRRRWWGALAAGLGFVLAAAVLVQHLRAVAARATDIRVTTMRRLIEVAATAPGVRQSRLPEIAVDARVNEATLDPVPRPPVEPVTIGGVAYARAFAATPRAGDDAALELLVRPSEAALRPTWGAMIALAVLGLAGLACAGWPAGGPAAGRAVRAPVAGGVAGPRPDSP